MATQVEIPGAMPVGNIIGAPIRPADIQTTEGNAAPAVMADDAAATVVWENYNRAKAYIENNAWLLEWQEADILYQSPIPNRFVRVESGRPARVPEFLVAKISRTMSRSIKRALFAEQYPFFLRPTGKTTQAQVDAWTDLIGKLLKRMKFEYYVGLLIDCQTLQGTGIGKMGWQTRTVTRKVRKRKAPALQAPMPDGTKPHVPTVEGDAFEIVAETREQSFPFFEYRKLGTTLFDAKWCTPDFPDESAGYSIDIDYVTFYDLQEMRKMSCYKNIPSDATLKAWLCYNQNTTAPIGTQIEDSMSSSGSMVVHAEARNRQTDHNPLQAPIMLIEQWDPCTAQTILVYEGRKLLIRKEAHDTGSSMHVTATFWPIDNSGYGMGIARLNGPDQRVKSGVKNEALKMIAYPMNAPLLIPRGQDAPTQNVLARLGGYMQVSVPPGGDVRRAVGFMEMPTIPADAWRMLDVVQKSAEELSGANSPFQQGNLPGPGSSAARTAAGATRIASMSDQSIMDPVNSVAYGVIVPVVQWLIQMVKEKMPLSEIREMLGDEHAAVIEKAIDEDQFLTADLEADVLAGARLAAKQGIQNLIPFFLQLVQQPQLLEYQHQLGKTVDFSVIEDLLLQVSELAQQPDIFRPMTKQEMEQYQQSNPKMAEVQKALAIEQAKGQNKIQEIHEKGEVDLGNKAAEIALQRTADGIPMERAMGLQMRSDDENVLRNGFPDFTQ